MQTLDEALLALDAEIFPGGSVVTKDDDLLAETLSQWNSVKRKNTFATLMKSYGKLDIGAQIVHALARLICRDVDRQLGVLLGNGNDPSEITSLGARPHDRSPSNLR
jgi:hypothetical protein